MSSLNYVMDMGPIKTLAKNMGVQGLGAEAALTLALTAAAIQIQGIARLQAPTKTGRLVNSIGYKIKGMTATISPSVNYGLYVETGTGIYGPKGQVIVPKSKKVLATKVNPGFGSKNKAGYFVIGKSSKGQQANPFMERTAELAKPVVLKEFKTAVSSLVKKYGN